jgi:electron transport complex protein RnfE
MSANTNTPLHLIREGLWKNNPGLVQLLGLCPLLAVTATTVNGLGLGIATTLTLIISNSIVALIRDIVRPAIRIPVYVLVIASTVTAIELILNAWFYDMYKTLGIFIPLIVTNCAIIGRAEAFASKNPVSLAFVDGLAMGTGFTLVLVVLGTLREVLGRGTIFSGAHMLFGESARALQITISSDYSGFLLAILPPGAFIGLGLLLAIKNLIDARADKRKRIVRESPITFHPATDSQTAR